MSKKYKKLYWALTCLASVVAGCVLMSTFASLVGIPVGIARSAVGLKICVITAGNKKCKSIIEKKEEKTW